MHCCISYAISQSPREKEMRLPNPYSLEETLGKLRDGLAAASNQGALALLDKAVTNASDDRAYTKEFEEAFLRGSTIEIRECLSCFGNYFERSQDAPPYYPYHDAVNGIDSTLYAILLTPILSRRMNNASIPKPGSSGPTP
ncbi:hypothetical protein ACWIJ6_17915 [Aeromonas piscicola]